MSEGDPTAAILVVSFFAFVILWVAQTEKEEDAQESLKIEDTQLAELFKAGKWLSLLTLFFGIALGLKG